MATFGVEFVIGIQPPIDDIEEKVDKFYTSLSSNFALKSIDLAWNDTKGSLSALLGVESPEGLDAEDLVSGIASDAVKKALVESGITDTAGDEEFMPSARILEFAA